MLYIHPNLPRNIIATLPHRRSRNSQGHETTFLAPSADKETHKYDKFL